MGALAHFHAFNRPLRLGLVAACWLAVLTPGCRPPQVQPTPADDIPLDLDSPESTARTLLACMRAEIAAIAARDGTKAMRYRLLIERDVADRQAVLEASQTLKSKGVNHDEIYRRITAGWESLIAYYKDGLALDGMVRELHAPDAEIIAIIVPATTKGDTAHVRITCKRGADQKWRAARVDFASPASAESLRAADRVRVSIESAANAATGNGEGRPASQESGPDPTVTPASQP